MASKVISELLYDVIVVGGGPIGLSSAYNLAIKNCKKVLVLEQFTFHNAYGSSPGFGRQFRVCYSEEQLTQLAIDSIPLWNELIYETGRDLVQFSGVLWFGDSNITNPEGNINAAIKNLDKLGYTNYEVYEDVEKFQQCFPFIQPQLAGNNFKGLHLPETGGGTIDVSELMKVFVEMLNKSKYCDIFDKSRVVEIDFSNVAFIQVKTSNGSIFKGKKVIMAPGVYINELLDTLKPSYDSRINTIIYLWCTNYYNIKPCSKVPANTWPVWFSFGIPEETSSILNGNAFYGFPSNDKDFPGRARVAPAFTSKADFNFKLFPPSIHCRPVDENALRFTSEFVKHSMKDLETGINPETVSTCVVGFATAKDAQDEPGFVLDFLPESNKRIVICSGGWAMKFVPIFGTILAELSLTGSTTYEKCIEGMNIQRGILIDVTLYKEKIFNK